MGSENPFLNCFMNNHSVAGMKTSNFYALQNTIIGGSFQACNIGVWVDRGSVPLIQSVGFQVSDQWDVVVDNSADDTLVISGRRTESTNFVKLGNYVHASITGCSQTAGPKGDFLQPSGYPTTVERCVSLAGRISVARDARLCLRGCSFGRSDWLSYGQLKLGRSIEIEDVEFGGAPNTTSAFSWVDRIARRRITGDGIFEYLLRPV
jgi:hypothetical protein